MTIYYRVVQHHDSGPVDPLLGTERPLSAAYPDRAQAEALAAAEEGDDYWQSTTIEAGTVNEQTGDFVVEP